MRSVPKRYRNKNDDALEYEPDVRFSDLGKRVEGFRREVVLQVFMQKGPAWDAVSERRRHWDISAKTGLPPTSSSYHNYPIPEHCGEEYIAGGRQSGEWVECAVRWGLDLDALRDQVVPEVYRRGPVDTSWRRFLAACVLFDPPETDLLAFSKVGEPRPVGILPAEKPFDPNFGFPAHAMILPPVATLRDADKAEMIEAWYWERIIDEIGERYLRPQGLDTKEILKEVVLETRDLLAKRKELRDRETPSRHYITVEEYTTESDVKHAFALISATLPERSEKGAPRRDLLIAVQCAILYDRHSQPNPSDRREWTWTYAKLASKFGLRSGRAAKDYVELGRGYLKQS